MEDAKKFYELDDECQLLKQTAEKKLLETIKKKFFNSVLEVGCGDGHLLNYLGDKEVFGIDINEGMLELAQGLDGKLAKVNIISDSNFVLSNLEKYDLIVSNYVFSEFKQQELLKAFKNVYNLLSSKGNFCFTMTDPRTRNDVFFPGYKLVFEEEYAYEKQDLEFKVLLEKRNGDFIDVGIRDFHQPLEVYVSLLQKAGFKNISKTEISDNYVKSYAVLFEMQK
jgi:SAM-dependent methyltransferase